jgi:hypothetical protein
VIPVARKIAAQFCGMSLKYLIENGNLFEQNLLSRLPSRLHQGFTTASTLHAALARAIAALLSCSAKSHDLA